MIVHQGSGVKNIPYYPIEDLTPFPKIMAGFTGPLLSLLMPRFDHGHNCAVPDILPLEHHFQRIFALVRAELVAFTLFDSDDGSPVSQVFGSLEAIGRDEHDKL
jgi:hypothetical protein